MTPPREEKSGSCLYLVLPVPGHEEPSILPSIMEGKVKTTQPRLGRWMDGGMDVGMTPPRGEKSGSCLYLLLPVPGHEKPSILPSIMEGEVKTTRPRLGRWRDGWRDDTPQGAG